MPLLGESSPNVNNTLRPSTRIHEGDIRNAVMDQVDLGRHEFLHHQPLIDPWLAQNGGKRNHDGHPQFAQERQDVTAGWTAE
jgi:hypothetical protein